MKRTSIPLLTSISIGLRAIPPSAGLARSPKSTIKSTIGHKVKRVNKSPLVMTVKKDIALEEELRAYRGGKK